MWETVDGVDICPRRWMEDAMNVIGVMNCPKLAENPMCLHVFAKKNRRFQKLSRPPSYAQFIPLVTQAMFGENWWVPWDGTWHIWHPHRRGGVRALGPWNLRAARAGPWAGPGAGGRALDAVHSGARPDGMGRDGKGWWWKMVDDGFSHVFSMFFHGFFWNLSDFVAGEAAEQRRRDLGSHSNGDGHCHAAVDQSSSGTGPYLGTTCGNRPSGPVPKKKKVKHHPEVRCSSSHPNKMGPTSSKPS